MTVRLILIFVFGAMLGPLQAASTTWSGGSGNWFDPAYWSNGVPDASTDVLIRSYSASISKGQTGNASSLTIGGSSVTEKGDLGISGGTLNTVYTYIGSSAGNTYAGSASIASGTWNNANAMRIGYGALAKLVVWGGAVTTGTTELGSLSGGDGTLNLDDGVYTTGNITEGAGTGHVLFNGGTLRAARSEADFLSGFEAGDLVISAGGALIDSNGYSIGISSVLSGTGPLVKTGAGDLTLKAANTFVGDTVIKAGRLVLDQGSIGGPAAAGSLTVGRDAGDDGTLGIYNGGSFLADYAPDGIVIGKAAGSKGTVVVNGGTLQSGSQMIVGSSGNGSVSLYDGTISSKAAILGFMAGSEGLVSVQGGIWQPGVSLYVGHQGKGTLEITGGTVSTSYLTMALSAGSEGSLVIGSTPDHQGVLETAGVGKGYGAAQVSIQGGVIRANQNDATFFHGFAAGEVSTTGRGAYLDTQGYEVSTGSGISGTGKVVKLGTGRLRMDAASTYSGGTMVMEGLLLSGNRDAFGTGLVTIDGGVLAVYDTTIYGVALKSGELTISPFGQSGLTLASGTSFSMTGGTWSLYQMMPGMHGTFLGDATNTFSITGGTLDLFGTVVDTSISYQLFEGFGSGSVSGLTITGYDTTRYLASLGNDGLLTFSAVPESQTILLVLAGSLCLAVMHRRMRRTLREG